MDKDFLNNPQSGFVCGETKILGMKWWDAHGNVHFAPAKEYIDKYIDAHIDSQKIFRPVNKITKQLI